MKQGSFTAIILTILMLLLVAIAAIVFLAQRNQELDKMVDVQSSNREEMVEMSEQMASDLTVRQAALESAEATREALTGQLASNQQQIQDLEEELSQTESELSQVGGELRELAVQLFIFSPKDGATVPPFEPLELFVAAKSDAGVETIEVSIDGETPVRYPSEGQPTATIRTEWSPPEEGEYLLSAVAMDRDGQSSQTESVTIKAAFSSPEARTNALRRLTESDVRVLRFPEALELSIQPETAIPIPDDLHRLLLTGRRSGETPITSGDLLLLQALEVVSSDLDLANVNNPAYQESILGTYDPESQELTIYQPGDEPETFGRWVHAHDYAHQMQDETFHLDTFDPTNLDGDARMALRALVEGEATYLQYLYVTDQFLDSRQQTEIFQGLNAAASDVMDDVAPYFQEEFDFAFTDGFSFIQSLHEADGFDTLNEVWQNLPQSTEQILHPDRYLDGDRPIPVTIAPLGEDFENWRLVGEDVLGEFLLRQHLDALGMSAGLVDQVATGWGGGRAVVYRNEDDGERIIQMRLSWDTPTDSSEFTNAYAPLLNQKYAGRGEAFPGGGLCWEGDDVTCLLSLSGDTMIIRAPDLETIDAIRAGS